ncbi:hypothetical protein PQ610_02100 [Tardisphaera miroshnichenkoae]
MGGPVAVRQGLVSPSEVRELVPSYLELLSSSNGSAMMRAWKSLPRLMEMGFVPVKEAKEHLQGLLQLLFVLGNVYLMGSIEGLTCLDGFISIGLFSGEGKGITFSFCQARTRGSGGRPGNACNFWLRRASCLQKT